MADDSERKVVVGKQSAGPLFSKATLLLIAFGMSLLALFVTSWLRGEYTPTLALPVVLLTLMLVLPLAQFVRQRCRLSLRTIIVLTTLSAILLGCFGTQVNRARVQGQAVESVVLAGGSVSYERSTDIGKDLVRIRGGWVVPTWLVEIGGQDLFLDTHWAVFQNQKLAEQALDDVQLEHFDRLDFHGVQFSRKVLERIASMESLRDLTLVSCGLTDADVEILSRLPNLESLRITNYFGAAPELTNKITDESWQHLVNLKGLRHLNWDSTFVTGAGLSTVVELPELETLSLSQTNIQNEDLAVLKQLASLRGLYVRGTKVDERCLETLQAMPKLKWVALTASSPEVKKQLSEQQYETRLTLYVD